MASASQSSWLLMAKMKFLKLSRWLLVNDFRVRELRRDDPECLTVSRQTELELSCDSQRICAAINGLLNDKLAFGQILIFRQRYAATVLVLYKIQLRH